MQKKKQHNFVLIWNPSKISSAYEQYTGEIRIYVILRIIQSNLNEIRKRERGSKFLQTLNSSICIRTERGFVAIKAIDINLVSAFGNHVITT